MKRKYRIVEFYDKGYRLYRYGEDVGIPHNSAVQFWLEKGDPTNAKLFAIARSYAAGLEEE